jgi:AAA family ATP:ADP antiporter
VHDRLLALFNLRPGELRVFLLSATTFFCVLSSYYVLRPIREAVGLEGGVDNLFWFYLGTLTGTLLLSPLFAWLVSRYPRRVFVPLAYRFLLLNLALFWLLFTFLPEGRRLGLIAVFFIWVSVFNVFIVSVFWALMADLFRSEQGKRLFGFIGVGGTLGGIVGAAITANLAGLVGPINLFFVSMVLLEAACRAVRGLTRASKGAFAVEPAAGSPPESGPEPAPAGPRAALQGITLVLRSSYLGGICLYIFLFTISSTFVYFTQARIVEASLADRVSRTEFFGTIDLWVNVATLAVQLFLTGRILPALGVGLTLGILPLVTGLGFTALGLAPSLVAVALFQVVRRSTNYSLARPAREVLYTVVSREEKYKAKNFIDTFVYRGGDAVGAVAQRLLHAHSPGTGSVALLMVPLAALWLVVGLLLGRRQRRLAGEERAA